jgi:hypothetical protein
MQFQDNIEADVSHFNQRADRAHSPQQQEYLFERVTGASTIISNPTAAPLTRHWGSTAFD